MSCSVAVVVVLLVGLAKLSQGRPEPAASVFLRLRRSQRPPAANLTTQPGADHPYRQPRKVFSRRQPAGARAASRFGSKTGFFPSWTPLLPMGVTLKKNDC